MRINTETAAAIARLAATLAAAIAAGAGLALDADALTTGILCALALGCFVWSWWKNNNVTAAAQEAQDFLDELKSAIDYSE